MAPEGRKVVSLKQRLHYTTLQNTTLCSLHHTTPATATALHNYIALHSITLHTLHYITLDYIKLQLQLHCTTTTTTTTTALHHIASSNCGEVNTATIAATLKKQLQPPSGQSVDSLCHPRFTPTSPIGFLFFDTSAITLSGTTGNYLV